MRALIRFFIPLLLLLPLASTAEDAGTINRRMVERLPAIDALKERQVVGENNQGFLEVRGAATGDEEQVVAAENRDRTAIYGLIARRESTSSEAVGRARARQIADRSKAGVLLQASDGSWYQKK